MRIPNIPLLLLSLMVLSKCCLDPSQAWGNCTQCPSTQVLIESSCFDKMRGCATYKVVNKTLACGACQSGYTVFQDKCERKAIVDALLGVKTNQTSIPPVVIDSPGNLTLQNVTLPATNQSANNTEQKQRNLTKFMPVFPQLRVIAIPFPANFSKVAIFSPPKRIGVIALPVGVQKMVKTKFPNLQNSRPVEIGYEEDRNSLFINQDKFWVMYEEGTILLIEKIRKPELANGKTDKNEEVKYTLTELFHHHNIQRQINKVKSELLVKLPQNLNPSLALNYNLKLSSNRTISLNIDISTGQIRCLGPSENLQECLEAVSKVSEMSKYNQYLKYSYSQFLQSISVVNVPAQVIAAEVYKNQASQTSTDFVFRIVYGGGTTLAEQEYSLFRYNAEKNATQILGYFIQDNNLLNLFKNTSKINPNNSAQSTANESLSKPNPVTTNNETISNGSDNMNFSEIQKKPVLGSQFGKNISKFDQKINSTDSTNEKNGTQASTEKPLPKSKPIDQITVKSKNQKILKTCSIKTQADFVAYLLKTNFASNLSPTHKIISFYNQSATNWQIYKAQIITSSSVYSVTVKENLEDNQLQVSQELVNEFSCWSAEKDPVAIKIDGYLKKTYPIIKTYEQMIAHFRIDGDNQKYYLIYVNEQRRRIVFEVSKVKESLNYVISRYEPHDYGYCFEKNDLQYIGFRLSQYTQRTLEDGGRYNYLIPYKQVLNELISKYKTYLSTSTLEAILANGTHAKVFLTNKFATFQYRGKLEQSRERQRGQFTLIQQKYGDHILPLGFKKENLISTKDVDYSVYKFVEDSLMKRYKTYFGGGNLEFFGQKRKGEQFFDIAIKTAMGYFCLSASQVGRESISLTPLTKASQYEQTQMPNCKQTENLDRNDRKCYPKVVGCIRQIGSICVMCQPELILQGGRRQCRKSCAW